MLTRMLEKEEKNLNGYCIDGYPRTEEQLDHFKQKVPLVTLCDHWFTIALMMGLVALSRYLTKYGKLVQANCWGHLTS